MHIGKWNIVKYLIPRIERFFTLFKMTIHSPPVFDHLRLASEWRSFAHRQMENRKIKHFAQNDTVRSLSY